MSIWFVKIVLMVFMAVMFMASGADAADSVHARGKDRQDKERAAVGFLLAGIICLVALTVL